jgi:lipopolysaccharide export LptBFGC system permease protein LptF
VIYLPDVLRAVTLAALAVVLVVLPLAMDMRHHPRRVQALVAGILCFVVSGASRISHHWGEPLTWDRSPALLLGSMLLTCYCAAAMHARSRR